MIHIRSNTDNSRNLEQALAAQSLYFVLFFRSALLIKRIQRITGFAKLLCYFYNSTKEFRRCMR